VVVVVAVGGGWYRKPMIQRANREGGTMGLDIWFAEDIRNALLAANEASGQTAAMVAMLEPRPEPRELRAFRDGFKAALVTVALAFGFSPQLIRKVETHDTVYLDASG